MKDLPWNHVKTMDKIKLKRKFKVENPDNVPAASPSTRCLGAALSLVLVSENDLLKKL